MFFCGLAVSVNKIKFIVHNDINRLIDELKPESNRLLCSNTVIGTLNVDWRAVTFGTARRRLGWLRPRPVPSSLYQPSTASIPIWYCLMWYTVIASAV